MAQVETELGKQVQVAATRLGHRLFRNNNGVLKDHLGHRVKYGLGNGSPDFVGWTKHGRFLGVEMKQPGEKPTPEQQAWLDSINRMGGIGLCVRSVDEFLDYFKLYDY